MTKVILSTSLSPVLTAASSTQSPHMNLICRITWPLLLIFLSRTNLPLLSRSSLAVPGLNWILPYLKTTFGPLNFSLFLLTPLLNLPPNCTPPLQMHSTSRSLFGLLRSLPANLSLGSRRKSVKPSAAVVSSSVLGAGSVFRRTRPDLKPNVKLFVNWYLGQNQVFLPILLLIALAILGPSGKL